MKAKRFAVLLVLLMLMTALTLSLIVFAAPTEGKPALTDETILFTETQDIPVKQPAVTSVEATASIKAPVAAPTTEPTSAPLSPDALTPDGQATVLDYYKFETDEKQFYTIATPAGNVFYLVVDGARGSENVYFLNAVTEADLMALAAKNDRIDLTATSSAQKCTCTEKCESGKANAACPVCKKDISKCIGSGKASTSDEAHTGSGETPDKGDGDNKMMYIIIISAFVLIIGIGIYSKIIKPKKQGSSFDDDDEFEDEYVNPGGEYGDEHYGSPGYLPEDDYEDEE